MHGRAAHPSYRSYRSYPTLVPVLPRGDEGRTRKWRTRFLVLVGRAERGRHRAPPQAEPSRRCGTYGREPRRICAPSRRLGGRGPLSRRHTARPCDGCCDDCACGRVRPGADSHHRPRAGTRSWTLCVRRARAEEDDAEHRRSPSPRGSTGTRVESTTRTIEGRKDRLKAGLHTPSEDGTTSQGLPIADWGEWDTRRPPQAVEKAGRRFGLRIGGRNPPLSRQGVRLRSQGSANPKVFGGGSGGNRSPQERFPPVSLFT